MSRRTYMPGTYPAVFKHLRDHLGQRFTAGHLASITGLPKSAIANCLSSAYARGYSSVQRARRSGADQAMLYWIGTSPAVESELKDSQRVARWLSKHAKPAVPSVIAAALGLEPTFVAGELASMAARGEAVRCELLTRPVGVDRFEYRISEATAPSSYSSALRKRASALGGLSA
jgi:hypothetical protein